MLIVTGERRPNRFLALGTQLLLHMLRKTVAAPLSIGRRFTLVYNGSAVSRAPRLLADLSTVRLAAAALFDHSSAVTAAPTESCFSSRPVAELYPWDESSSSSSNGVWYVCVLVMSS